MVAENTGAKKIRGPKASRGKVEGKTLGRTERITRASAQVDDLENFLEGQSGSEFVRAKIEARREALGTSMDAEAVKKEEDKLGERTPREVINKYRDCIRFAQSARLMSKRIFYRKQELKKNPLPTKPEDDTEDDKKRRREILNLDKLTTYWAKVRSESDEDMYKMETQYGLALEALHKEYVADFMEYLKFERNFYALAAAEKQRLNYKPDLMGLEEDKSSRGLETSAFITEALQGERVSDEEFAEHVPAPGKEVPDDPESVLKFANEMFDDPEEARAWALDLQQIVHPTDEAPSAEVVDEIRHLSLSELNQRITLLTADCEKQWQKKTTQDRWNERFHDRLRKQRLRGAKVLELPSTIGYLNEIDGVIRDHPNTTIGVCLVGDPGVGKTTLIELYLEKKGRQCDYLDVSQEVNRYILLGSPEVHIESQLDFYNRMSRQFGDLSDDQMRDMVHENAKKLQAGFTSLTDEEREIMALDMLREDLDQLTALDHLASPELRKLLESQDLPTVKAAVYAGEGAFAGLLSQKKGQLAAEQPSLGEDRLIAFAQRAVLEDLENTHTSMNLSDDVKARLGKVREGMARVANQKYTTEVANRFAELTKKNGWRDGFVIRALRADHDILFDEYNAAPDWKLLHHLMTSKPGTVYQFGDRGESIPIPPKWRMHFTGNIQTKQGVNKVREALVSRIGGAVIRVEPPPKSEEWMLTDISLQDANGVFTRDFRDKVLLFRLVNEKFQDIRDYIKKAGAMANIVPISHRVIDRICGQLMNRDTQLPTVNSVDAAVFKELVRPYHNYPDVIYPSGPGENQSQLPTLIAQALVDIGIGLIPEMEQEVLAWTGYTKEGLVKKREAYEQKDWEGDWRQQAEKAKNLMSAALPVMLMV